MTALLIAVPLVPLLAALVIPVLGKHLPSGWVSAGATGVSFVLLLAMFGLQPEVTATWLGVGPYTLTVGLSLDSLSYLLALSVAGCRFPGRSVRRRLHDRRRGQTPFLRYAVVFYRGDADPCSKQFSGALVRGWEGVGSRRIY